MEILSYVEQIGDIATDIDYQQVTAQDIEANAVRCPDSDIASRMIDLINIVKNEQDSIGGIIKGVIRRPPAGLGEPVFETICRFRQSHAQH